MCTHSKQNVAMADELVLCQEDQTQIHHLTTISTVCCHMDHFFTAILAWRAAYWRPAWSNKLCKTNSSSKQLLNDVIFIWFTYKNLFALATMKNSYNNKLHTSMATKKKHIGANCYLHTRMTLFFADGVWQCVKICLHRSDISGSWNSKSIKCYFSLLLPQNAACHMSGLYRVQKQYTGVQVTLVFLTIFYKVV